MKLLQKIYTIIFITISFLPTVFAATGDDLNLDTRDVNTGVIRDNYVNDAKGWFSNSFFGGSKVGEEGAQGLVFTIAKDLKNVLIAVTIIFLIVVTLRLFFGGGSEDDQKKWRSSILWASFGIVIMQMGFSAVMVMFDQGLGPSLGKDFLEAVLMPIVRLLEVATSFAFIAMAIIAFFRMVGSQGSDEGYKKGINSVINAVLGYIMVKISATLVYSIYGDTQCTSTMLGTSVCTAPGGPNISETAKIFAALIKYLTGFIGVITIILIIYAGFLMLTSSGDESKSKKAKSIIKFIVIGIIIIAISVVLFNFMLGKDISGTIGGFR